MIAISATTLSSCASKAEKAAKQYESAVHAGGSQTALCERARRVVELYLDEGDAQNVAIFSRAARAHCAIGGLFDNPSSLHESIEVEAPAVTPAIRTEARRERNEAVRRDLNDTLALGQEFGESYRAAVERSFIHTDATGYRGGTREAESIRARADLERSLRAAGMDPDADRKTDNAGREP